MAPLLMEGQQRQKSNPALCNQALLEVLWGLSRASLNTMKPCVYSRQGIPHVIFFFEFGECLDLGHSCDAWHHLSKEDLLTIYLHLDT